MARFLGSVASAGPGLRERIEAGEMVLAPGCYHALGARLVEEAGFSAAYMTGFGSAAARLGRPDVGLMTLPEMVDNARRIAQAVDIPIVADADTGYGNSINAIRTVRRDVNDRLKKLLKDHKISEDDERRALTEVQKFTDQYIHEIDDLQKKKDAELLGR